MMSTLSPFARWTALAISLVALASIYGLYLFNMQTDRYGTEQDTIWAMARFFTILTSVLVAVTFAVTALRHSLRRPGWLAALTLSVSLIAGVYHTLLAGITPLSGVGILANQGMHTVMPAACVIWWFAFAPKSTLEVRDLPMFIVWPCVYVAYALWRGSKDGIYPYPFMDLTQLSATAVLINLSALFGVLLIGGLVFVLIGRFADR